jgi:hypothetical protein
LRYAAGGTIAVLLCVRAVSGVAAEQPDTGMLSGTVVDEAGGAVPGARVTVDWFDALADQTRTDAETHTDERGAFRLGPLAARHRVGHPVRVEANAFAAQYVPAEAYSVYPGTNHSLGRIVLVRGCVGRGLVHDADDSPAAGATVEYQVHRYSHGHTIEPITALRTVATDHEGRFETEPLPCGVLNLRVTAPGRVRVRQVAPISQPGDLSLESIRLEQDVPIRGRLLEQNGSPISGATIWADGRVAQRSDQEGTFIIGGFGRTSKLQLLVKREGYVFRNLMVERTDEGFRWAEAINVLKTTTQNELEIPLEKAAWIEGAAADAETGEPVTLDRVVLCFFQRKPNGEVALTGCRVSQFEQPAPGRFRVSYMRPTEYHLSFSAKGYHDAEAFTPKVDELKPITGIDVRLSKKTSKKKAGIAHQLISGKLTRGGEPVTAGWVGLWSMRRPLNAINSPMLRGRTVSASPIVAAASPIRDGRYTLDVPYQSKNWYVVADLPGRPLVQLGPLDVALDEEKSLDIEIPAAARVRGKVTGAAAELRGRLWVVAYNKTSLRAEAPVSEDGTFVIELSPGEYGLKAGHDGYQDLAVPRGKTSFADIPREKLRTMADPWTQAKIITLAEGQEVTGVELTLP